MISRIKGTQDFLNVKLFNLIVDQGKKFFSRYHFHEISTPILEPSELFKRSLGLDTDVVSKEMFIVSSEHETDSSICLRPEATAATLRAFLQAGNISTPWKVFSVGPMFRYERPQKGRYRQFHQVNVEVIGSDSVAQDVQLITMLDRFFSEQLMLDSYALLINYLGCFEDRTVYKHKVYDFLTTIVDQLCDNCKIRKEKNVLRVLDCKNKVCRSLYKDAPKLTDHLCKSCEADWKRLQEQLKLLSVSYSHSPYLVRGLDYYDKVVFEFVSDNLGAQNAFCSGGRYNRLAQELGSKQSVPAVGAAMGIERLMLLLEPIQDRLPIAQEQPLHVILPLESEQATLALLFADELLAKGLSVDVLLEGDSVKNMMRKANKMGASYCLIIGPDEQATQEVTIKNMVTGDEQRVKQIDAVELLKK